LDVAAVGVGAVDSVFKAIERIVDQEFVLDNFTVQSVTDSSDALGRVTVRIQPPGDNDANVPTFSGHGTHIDILVASARALVNAVNKLQEGKHAAWRDKQFLAHPSVPLVRWIQAKTVSPPFR
jgi:2-isopropylmalate synthase